MKNWKTTIGGALSALGTSVAGLATIGAFAQPEYRTYALWCIAGGALLSAIGKFLGLLFAQDALNSDPTANRQQPSPGFDPPRDAGPPRMPALAWLLVPLLAMGLGSTTLGCKHAPTLETGGAYAQTNAQPDLAFYVADSAFDTAFATLEGTFKFERDNRDALWKISPDIKHTLDKIRPTAWEVVQRYSTARAVYIANPVPPNLPPLQLALADLQRLTATAIAALPK